MNDLLRRAPGRRRARRRWPRLLGAMLVAGACSGSDGSGSDPDHPPGARPNGGRCPPSPVGWSCTRRSRPRAGGGGSGLRPAPAERGGGGRRPSPPTPRWPGPWCRRVHSRRDGRLVGRTLILGSTAPSCSTRPCSTPSYEARWRPSAPGRPRSSSWPADPCSAPAAETCSAVGYREGDLLVVVTGTVDHDIQVVVARQLDGHGGGGHGVAATPSPRWSRSPSTPPSCRCPRLAFQVIPPPEEEPVPPAPTFAGATGVDGRYGVVAGERRTTVWVFTVDPATYPSAERLEPAMAALAVGAGGAPVARGGSRWSTGSCTAPTAADGAPSARVFRHQGLVLLVEGLIPPRSTRRRPPGSPRCNNVCGRFRPDSGRNRPQTLGRDRAVGRRIAQLGSRFASMLAATALTREATMEPSAVVDGALRAGVAVARPATSTASATTQRVANGLVSARCLLAAPEARRRHVASTVVQARAAAASGLWSKTLAWRTKSTTDVGGPTPGRAR